MKIGTLAQILTLSDAAIGFSRKEMPWGSQALIAPATRGTQS